MNLFENIEGLHALFRLGIATGRVVGEILCVRTPFRLPFVHADTWIPHG